MVLIDMDAARGQVTRRVSEERERETRRVSEEREQKPDA